MHAISANAKAASEPLSLTGPVRVEALSAKTDFQLDATWDLTIEDITGTKATDFAPLNMSSPNFGFTDSRIWLRIPLRNDMTDIDSWFLYVHENFLQHYDVYVQRADGRVEQVEAQNPDSRFSDRSVAFPQLATEIALDPGETVTLYLAYWSEGSSRISLSFENKPSFTTLSLQQTSKNFVSYGMMLILILTSGIALFILRIRVFFSYIVYVVITLLFLMHSDGVAFQYLWPNAPGWNSRFSIVIGLAFAMVPYNFARVFLRTKIYHPRMDRFMVWAMILTPVFIIPSALIDPQFTKQILMLLVFFAITFGTFAGLVAAQTRFKEVRFYVFAWIFGTASAGIMNLRHFTNVEIGQNLELDSIRVSIVVDAIMMGLGVADRYIQNLKQSQKIDRESLMQAQVNLELNTRLYDLEEQYKLATELVASRNEAIKKTVHDLRDPLHSLRLNVQKLQDRRLTSGQDRADYDQTFTYVQNLITDVLQDTVTEVGADMPVLSGEPSDLDLHQTLAAVHEMFLPDAQAKGLVFRYVPTRASSDADPFAVMRILSNLVSNAIKYTPNGQVLLGVKRRQGRLGIEVHDTGIGLTAAEFEAACQTRVRLPEGQDEADGYGYGLAITQELCGQQGFNLSLLPRKGQGTSLRLSL